MKKHIETFLLMIALLLMLAASAEAKVFRFETTHEYQVEDDFSLEIDNNSGDVTVVYSAGDLVVVEAVKEIRASSRSEAEDLEDELQVIIEADEHSIEIETRYPSWRSGDSFWEKLFDIRKGGFGSVDYRVEVPVSVKLRISTTSGDVRLSDLSGQVDVFSTSGDLEISGLTGDCLIKNTSADMVLRDIAGSADISSTSGDILIDNVTGEVRLSSTSGDSEFYWISGSVYVTKTSGEVRVEEVSGDIDINTTSGDIFVVQREGGLFVSTSSGDVFVTSEVLHGDRFDIETISGDISFKVPAEMNGQVRLQTVSGNIDTDLSLEVRSVGRHKLEGSVGSGGPLVDLSSTSGDITLEEF